MNNKELINRWRKEKMNKELIHAQLFYSITGFFAIIYGYIIINLPQEVKDCFNVSDLGSGWFILIMGIIFLIGFLTLLIKKSDEEDTIKVFSK